MTRSQNEGFHEEREIAMFKRIGILALMLSATGAVLLPTAALAQDRYCAPGYNYYQSNRDWDRDEFHERRDRRADEWRQRAYREQERREHEWRDRDYRGDRYDQYRRDAYRGSDYQR
jgi:Ni/Co efflux regulator RcnB